jgi:hypothetical protein
MHFEENFHEFLTKFDTDNLKLESRPAIDCFIVEASPDNGLPPVFRLTPDDIMILINYFVRARPYDLAIYYAKNPSQSGSLSSSEAAHLIISNFDRRMSAGLFEPEAKWVFRWL